ncbi:hypothetical protein [Amycolatopsis sp. NPDC004772]
MRTVDTVEHPPLDPVDRTTESKARMSKCFFAVITLALALLFTGPVADSQKDYWNPDDVTVSAIA